CFHGDFWLKIDLELFLLDSFADSVYNIIFQPLLSAERIIIDSDRYRRMGLDLLSRIVRSVYGDGSSQTAGLNEIDACAHTDFGAQEFICLKLHKLFVQAVQPLKESFPLGIGNQHQKLIRNNTCKKGIRLRRYLVYEEAAVFL